MCKGACDSCKKSLCVSCSEGDCSTCSVNPQKSLGTITITEEEKDLLVKLLNNTLFRIHDLVVADKILDKIDGAFPIDCD